MKKAVKAALNALKVDGWQNVLTGLGNIARDRTMGHQISISNPSTSGELSAIYHDDPLGNKIAQRVIKEALRQGINLGHSGEDEEDSYADKRNAIETEIDRLGFLTACYSAGVWARVYGLGAVYLSVPDSGEPYEPLEIRQGQQIASLIVLEPESHGLRPYSFYSSDSAKPGEAEIYQVSQLGKDTVFTTVHESRLLVFRGELTSDLQRQANDWRDYSILHLCKNAIRNYDSMMQSIGNMVTDASLGILKITGLHDSIASNLTSAIKTRLELFDLGRFVGRAIPLDAQGEDFSFVERTMSGIDAVVLREQQRVAAAAEIPETILFGRAPAGLNATGESDIRTWYDSVQWHREQRLGPPMLRGIQTICQSLGLNPDDWWIDWPTLWQRNPDEEQAHRKSVAETDAIYLQHGVVSPSEVAETRFSEPGVFNDGPVLVDNDMPDGQSKDLIAEAVQTEMQAPQAIEPQGEQMPSVQEQIDQIMKNAESLVKAGAPQEMIRALMMKAAEKMGIADQAVQSAINANNFTWYTSTATVAPQNLPESEVVE